MRVETSIIDEALVCKRFSGVHTSDVAEYNYFFDGATEHGECKPGCSGDCYATLKAKADTDKAGEKADKSDTLDFLKFFGKAGTGKAGVKAGTVKAAPTRIGSDSEGAGGAGSVRFSESEISGHISAAIGKKRVHEEAFSPIRLKRTDSVPRPGS